MKEIRGDSKNMRSLLDRAKCTIDYYQREYHWQREQVRELLEDRTEKFKNSYEGGHDQSDVEHYGHYFRGSIIASAKGHKFIIDGQQRLTILTAYSYTHVSNSHRRRSESSTCQLEQAIRIA